VLVHVSVRTLWLKSFILAIKHCQRSLYGFVAGLLEGARTSQLLGSEFVLRLARESNVFHSCHVLAWTWDVVVDTVSIEDLVLRDSRRGLIKTNAPACKVLVILSPFSFNPVGSRVLEIVLHSVLGFNNVFLTFEKLVLHFWVF
jgi:hypothetical protein